MEKKWSLIIILIIVISLLLHFTGAVKADSEDGITFLQETNPDFIGSYITMNPNGSFDDYNRDAWKSAIHLFMDWESCIVPAQGKETTFYADYERGWHWFPKENFFGKTCYKLSKN